MKQFHTFLSCVLCAIFGTSAFAGVGDADSRKYVDWRKYPEIVHLKTHEIVEEDRYIVRRRGGATCTGQYISPNLILTASHCIKDKKGNVIPGNNYAFRPGDKYTPPINEQGGYPEGSKDNKSGDYIEGFFETFDIELVYSPKDYRGTTNVKDKNYLADWAVFKVVDPKYYAKKYFQMDNIKDGKTVSIYNGGWGWVTKLSNEDIDKMKPVFLQYYEQKCNEKNHEMRNGVCTKKDTGQEIRLTGMGQSLELQRALEQAIGRALRDDSEDHKFKLDDSCDVERRCSSTHCYLESKCDDWAGNSGGPFVDRSSNKLLGIVDTVAGQQFDFDETTHFASGVAIEEMKKTLNKIIKANPPKEGSTTIQTKEDVPKAVTSTVNITNTIPAVDHSNENKDILNSTMTAMNGYGFTGDANLSSIINPNVATPLTTDPNVDNDDKDGATDEEREIERGVSVGMATAARQGKDLTRKDLVRLVVAPVVEGNEKIRQLEEYKKAKARETSLANRTLTALTMAATGIGGMELARGLAEQKADKAAEADMTAYMSTFQCKVGDKRYTGNDTQIEIAGGNELIKLYQEYVDLANSLKERKAALGKKAGIESEVILDKANMGLYDETGKGIENGTYASLYRASKGNETDIAKLQEQQDASKKRVIAGAVVGGAGAVGGMVGNILINGKNDNNDDETIAKDYVVSDNNTVNTDEDEEEEIEAEQIADSGGVSVNTRTPGCSVNSSVSTIPDACKSNYSSDANEQSRCLKCVNNAGTYEAGRCYVEVIGWACLGKGWPNDNSKATNPAPCSTMSNRYQDCHIVRKYADAEKPFTCDPMTSIAPGKTALVSGCGQHGWSVGDKHPPFNLDGPNAVGQNCKLPLSSNMAWRKMYSKGSAIGVTFGGKSVTTGRWCMPSANSSPWNDSNHSGAAKHLLPSSLMAGGESKDKWFSLD